MILKQEDYSVKPRKRAFELIEKLFSNALDSSFIEWLAKGGPFKSAKGKITIEELHELIDIFANTNPYQYHNRAKVEYEDSFQEEGTTGQYDREKNTISILNKFIENIQKNPIHFTDLIELIGHEQRHHYQFDHRDEVLSGDHINDIYSEMDAGNLSNEDIEEINKFLIEHNLSNEKMTKEEISRYQFGAYLSNACEIDARKYGYKFTVKMFTSMINDDLCPKQLREKLQKSLVKYEKREKKHIESQNEEMDKFKCLRKKLKNAFQKVLKEDELELSSLKTLMLLNKCMRHISKDMTTEEKIEFMNWAVEHNYTSILENISFNDKSDEKKAILGFVQNSVTDKKINSINAVAFMYIVALQHKDDEIKSLDSLKLTISKIIETNQFEALSSLTYMISKESGLDVLVEKIKNQTKLYLENINENSYKIYNGLYITLNNLFLCNIDEKDKIELGILLEDLIKRKEDIYSYISIKENNDIF